MHKIKYFVLSVVMVMSLAFSAMAEPMAFGVVDVLRVTRDSKTGKAIGAHLEQVQKVLQDGMNEVVKVQQNQSDEDKRKAYAEASGMLNRQLEIERAAVIQIIDKEIVFAVNEWMKTSKCPLVMSKQNVLGAVDEIDITDEIIKIMDTRADLIKLPALPKVTVNPPTAPKQAANANKEVSKAPEQEKQKAAAPKQAAQKTNEKSQSKPQQKAKNQRKK